MASVLASVALGLSVLALAHGFTRTLAGNRRHGAGADREWDLGGLRQPASLRPLLITAGLLLAAGVLLTLPTRPPWSPGQGLASGLLVGGAVALLALFARRMPHTAVEGDDYRAAAMQVAAATVGIGLLLVLFPRSLFDPLAGYAMGAITVALVLAALRSAADDDGAGVAEAAERIALIAVTLAAVTDLAAYHRSPTGEREWQPLPALLMATLAAGLAARGVIRSPARPWLWTAALTLLPLGVISALIAYRLHGTPAFLPVVFVGLAAFGLIAWLEPGPVGDAPSGSRPFLHADRGLLAALLVLGAGVLAFRELHGFGLGLLALTGIAAAALGPAREERPLLTGATALAVLLVLYRVYHEAAERGPAFEPDFLYYHVALIGGALLPLALASWASRRAGTADAGSDPRDTPTLPRLLLAGAGAVLAPLVVWLAVGERPQSALVVGLGLGTALLLARGAAEPAAVRSLARLLSFGIAYSAVQLTGLLGALAMRTRMERVGILGAVAAAAIIWMAVTLWLERRSARVSRQQPAVSSQPSAVEPTG